MLLSFVIREILTSNVEIPGLIIKMLVRSATKIPFPRSKPKENDREMETLFCRGTNIFVTQIAHPHVAGFERGKGFLVKKNSKKSTNILMINPGRRFPLEN